MRLKDFCESVRQVPVVTSNTNRTTMQAERAGVPSSQLNTKLRLNRTLNNNSIVELPSSICFLFRVPCSMFRVPCSVFHIPCSVFHIPCSVFHIPCSVLPVPCSVLHVPCSVFHIPCSLFRVPYSVLHVPYSVFHIPCSLFRVPYSVFHVSCINQTCKMYKGTKNASVFMNVIL